MIGIIGASGKLGRTIITQIVLDQAYHLVGGVGSPNSLHLGRDLGELIGSNPIGICLSSDYASLFEKSDVLIDVSLASNLENTLFFACKGKKPLVIGTTGHGQEEMAVMKHAAKSIPLFYTPNFSLGIAAMTQATSVLSQILGEEYAISIKETHHMHKKDQPSGTALSLARSLASHRKPPPIQSERFGEVTGEHTISFTTENEEITLSHRAISRALFAKGALRAAKFLATQPCGFYSMGELLT